MWLCAHSHPSSHSQPQPSSSLSSSSSSLLVSRSSILNPLPQVREQDLTRSMLDRDIGAGGRAMMTARIGATMSLYNVPIDLL